MCLRVLLASTSSATVLKFAATGGFDRLSTRMVPQTRWLSLSKPPSSNGNISVAELVEAAG